MLDSVCSLAARACWRLAAKLTPSGRGVTFANPGNFYSPLLDIRELERDPQAFLASSHRGWDRVDLRPAAHEAWLERFLSAPEAYELPREPKPPRRYGWGNDFFTYPDAWVLARLFAVLQPRRVIEVGSGFSSALMLDLRDHHAWRDCSFTFIEPYPDRLKMLLAGDDWNGVVLRAEPVQLVPDSVFETLESGDVLFIDSSHVAKVGSDLTDLLVRVLPRVKPGVWVHFHDIFYPSYPLSWLREGRAWNEVPVVQAVLANGSPFDVEWFNSYAAEHFGERLTQLLPQGKRWAGGSLWLRRR